MGFDAKNPPDSCSPSARAQTLPDVPAVPDGSDATWADVIEQRRTATIELSA